MGFLNSAYLSSDYSMAETRILFEIKTHGVCIQKDIAETLHMDKSQLSKILNKLHQKGLINKQRASEDKRAFKITLTETGKTETQRLVELTNSRIEAQIKNLTSAECIHLHDALQTVIEILRKEEQYESHTL